jgi:Uma2 family endonuclease
MAVEKFLTSSDARPGDERHAFIAGVPVAMAPERRRHVRATRSTANALDAAIAEAHLRWEAFVDGLAVRPSEGDIFLPDALVTRPADEDEDDVIEAAPIIVVEVVSAGR